MVPSSHINSTLSRQITCTSVCIVIYVYIWMSAYTYYVYTYLCIHLRTYTYVSLYIYICNTHRDRKIDIHEQGTLHIHVCTYICVHVHKSSCSSPLGLATRILWRTSPWPRQGPYVGCPGCKYGYKPSHK